MSPILLDRANDGEEYDAGEDNDTDADDSLS